MEIEAGKYYRTRVGQKVGPARKNRNGNCTYPWSVPHNGGFHAYTSKGKSCLLGGDDDIVAEWVDEKDDAASSTPKTWGEMTDAEKGELLLANLDGNLQYGTYSFNGHPGGWNDKCNWFFDEKSYYRIKPEPKRETVTLRWCNEKGDGGKFGTIDIIDGEPEIGSIRMERIK
jgi:hypothetical protein